MRQEDIKGTQDYKKDTKSHLRGWRRDEEQKNLAEKIKQYGEKCWSNATQKSVTTPVVNVYCTSCYTRQMKAIQIETKWEKIKHYHDNVSLLFTQRVFDSFCKDISVGESLMRLNCLISHFHLFLALGVT
jgi:hypothetical protein